MTSILNRFINRAEFDSYEDFKENFKIIVPEGFNFAYDVLDVYADNNPDKVALKWCNEHGEDYTFSFKDIQKNCNKTVNFFKSLGIRKGDPVMISLKSRYEFWFIINALHKIGAKAIPATHMLKTRDIVYRLEKADVKMVVTIDENNLTDYYDEASKEYSQDFIKVSVDGDKEGWYNYHREIDKFSDEYTKMEEDKTNNDDISLIYFSSGTSGMPKMVNHTFTYPLAHIVTAKFWQNVQEDGLHYTIADTGWGKAVWGLLYGQWISGSATFVFDYDRFDAKKVIEKAIEHQITTFCAPPTIYRFLIKEDLEKYDLSNLQYAVTAGEVLNPEVFHRFKELTGLRIMEGFGQTETVVSIANFPWMETKVGSMGKPSPIYDVALLNGDNEEVDIGEEGEISIKIQDENIGLFTDYHKDSDKTDAVCHGGYYHTRDAAWMDEDNYLWFIGRTDDIIKSSGYRISPFEVESAVITHPAVLECAVTAYPDEIRGEIIKASIVLTKDYEASEELKQEIKNHVKSVTAPYKYPRRVEFVDEIPKTVNGKIRRETIRNEDLKKLQKE